MGSSFCEKVYEILLVMYIMVALTSWYQYQNVCKVKAYATFKKHEKQIKTVWRMFFFCIYILTGTFRRSLLQMLRKKSIIDYEHCPPVISI